MKLTKNKIKKIVSIITALIIALIVEKFFSFSHIFLIPITAVFVMLTTVGNVFFQSIKRFILMLVLVIGFSLILKSQHLLYPRIYDVCVGALIGILANIFLFPRRADAEFREAVLPVLIAYEEYFLAIVDLVFDQTKKNIEDRKIKIEKQLLCLPLWIYEPGFDMGLRKGHQYFLMKIHQIAEILFAMHHAARCSFDAELLEAMRTPLQECVSRVQSFLKALSTVFQLQKLAEGVEDFEVQVAELDQHFQSLIPTNAELLEISTEDTFFYEFIYGVNDLRKALVKLGQALR